MSKAKIFYFTLQDEHLNYETIAKLFNTYKFADYKEHVIDPLQRVCTVSVKTIEIIQQMPDTVEHQGG